MQQLVTKHMCSLNDHHTNYGVHKLEDNRVKRIDLLYLYSD